MAGIEKENCRIGIVGCGLQGKSIAFWFARRGFPTVLYDSNKNSIDTIQKEVFSEDRKYRIIRKYLTVAGGLDELKNCRLCIENITENLGAKQQVARVLEDCATCEMIVSSNSSTFTPTEISAYLKHKNLFVNIHFLGVPWGGTRVELVPGKHTSKETVRVTKNILQEANFTPIVIRECAGFVYNRIKLAEVSNLFRAIELGIVPLESGLRYTLFPRLSYPVAFVDFMGIDVSGASIISLNEAYGERFYIPRIFLEKIRQNNVGVKTGQGFLDHSQPIDFHLLFRRNNCRKPSTIQKMYIEDAPITLSSFIIQSIRKGKKLYFNNEENAYFILLKKINPDLYKKIITHVFFIDKSQNPPSCDAVVVGSRMPLTQLSSKVNAVQEKFGCDIPVLVNSPIYKFQDIGRDALNPSMIFGINCQKNYLENTEIVYPPSADEHLREQIALLIQEIAVNRIEVKDDYARPLTFALVPKMLESVRIIEETITDAENIEQCMDRDSVIRDMDYFGIDYLVEVSDYLCALYGEPFLVPDIIRKMVAEGLCGIASGKGFYSYF